MNRTPPTRLAALVLTSGLALSSLAGCGLLTAEDAETDATSGEVSPSPEPSPSVDSTPSVTPSPVAPSVSSEPSEAPGTTAPAALPDSLLAAADLPGLNDGFTWSAGRTRTTEPRELAGTCHRFDMLSIGATAVVHRRFEPPPNTNAVAGGLVAEFADEKTASRAYQTLLAWRGSCPEQLESYPRSDVSLLEDVALPEGRAGWWLAKYGPVGDDPDVAAFDAEGVALVGDRIAVVHMVSYGQDYNYPPGEEPIAEAIERAAAAIA